MALPRFIEIDGRRYLWRDLVALRRAQTTPVAQHRRCSLCAKIIGPPASATPRSAIASRACSPCRSGAVKNADRRRPGQAAECDL
jgi:hypothetical protein